MEISGKLTRKISELTIEELKTLITENVKDAVEEALENFEAISSNSYLNSVKEAREEYKKGDFQKLGMFFNVRGSTYKTCYKRSKKILTRQHKNLLKKN